MFPPRHHESRYLTAARKARLAHLAAIGAVTVIPVACAKSDAEVFDAAAAPTPTTVADAGAPGDAASAPTTTPSGTVGTTDAPTAPSAASTFPADAEMVVEFTYAATTTGRVHNPYVAVWIEDTDGNLVRTLAVWFEQSEKGTRWLRDLRQWASVSGAEVDTTVSGATRAPGTYSVVWDGTDEDGRRVAQGEYVVVVESAREHGPYQATSAAITVSEHEFGVTLPDDGELTDLTATMIV